MSKQIQKVKGEIRRTKSNALVQKGHRGFLTVFEPETAEKIVETVRGGMPLAFAANLARVNAVTVQSWVARGEQDPDHELFGPFAADIREAQAAFVQEAIEGIKDAGLSDAKQWTALMTLLERIYPEYFKRPDSRQNINVNVAVGVVERQLHELHEAGEIVYEGG